MAHKMGDQMVRGNRDSKEPERRKAERDRVAKEVSKMGVLGANTAAGKRGKAY